MSKPSFKLDDEIFCHINSLLYFLSLFIEMTYYIVLCIDLIVTLIWPFISGKSRMLWYHIFVIVYNAATFRFIWVDVKLLCNGKSEDSDMHYVALFVA